MFRLLIDYSKTFIKYNNKFAELFFELLIIWPNLLGCAWIVAAGQGCIRQGRPLCCSGRNLNCSSRDVPLRPLYRFTIPSSKELPAVYCEKENLQERIGFLGVLPGFIALEQRGQEILNGMKTQHPGGNFRLYERREENPEALVFEFGWPWEEWSVADRTVKDQQSGWPLIRYSLLNKHLPLRIIHQAHSSKSQKHQMQLPPSIQQRGRQHNPLTEHWRTFFLTEAGFECFCDQICVKYGDCCADYMSRCPRVDCQVSHWSEWSECLADWNISCGVGIRERHRTILRMKENAGADCPADLDQQIGCFKECRYGPMEQGEQLTPDVTTVALLLDYRFNKSRQVLPPLYKSGQKVMRKNRRETNQYGADSYSKYCVHYKIEWLNRNCLEPEWNRKLRQGQRICAECQPEAQYHRSHPRCASDLEDGQSGFWKLIGPKSCYGIWRRLYSTNSDCDCPRQFPNLNPFLMV